MNLVPGADALVVELAEAANDAVGDVGAAGEQGLPAVRPDDPSGVEVHKVDLQGEGEGVNEWRALEDLEEREWAHARLLCWRRKLPSLADIDEAKMSGGFCHARVYSADFAYKGKVSRESFRLIQKGRVRWVGGEGANKSLV